MKKFVVLIVLLVFLISNGGMVLAEPTPPADSSSEVEGEIEKERKRNEREVKDPEHVDKLHKAKRESGEQFGEKPHRPPTPKEK